MAASTTTDFATAQTTCSGLGLNGHTWRTPSIKELSTLVDEVPPISKVSPAIDTTTVQVANEVTTPTKNATALVVQTGRRAISRRRQMPEHAVADVLEIRRASGEIGVLPAAITGDFVGYCGLPRYGRRLAG